MLKCQNPSCGKMFLYAAKRNATVPIEKEDFVSIETHICPYCQSLDIAEVEKTDPRIESIVSVKIPEADEWIKKGYEVAGMYASTVNLVRKAKEEK